MPAIQSYFSLLQINAQHLSKSEIAFFEAELFLFIGSQLFELIRKPDNDCLSNSNININKEIKVIEASLIRCIINDILSSDEYDLKGIAYYTDTPEDVIHDIVIGYNKSPSLLLTRKLIELHRSVRPSLYRNIGEKIKRELIGYVVE
ncbi:MAG: hypothetical protein A3F14_00300 [Gammaproteobacteria bacterium RIFCSPHIGHO2_12_FULL_43_28]|nr:MAG: hypothetical protein A3F14_00300 [Gammaproteobacteria bacterium RIFCSPHIGHO2_12_FULL_43_28]